MTIKERTDPVEEADDGSADLYDIATWQERSSLDGLSVAIYRLLSASARWGLILLAFLLLVGIGGFSALTDPAIGVLTVLSAVPALGLAAYVYKSDITTNEPVTILVATFLLGVLTANFAAVLNSFARPAFEALGFLGTVLFFFLIVGPVEETVKLLAVRLYAYTDDSFDAVLDGAVYGAMAGLGFAFIENALYITQGIGVAPGELDLGLGLIGLGGGITATRALAGPGHVIYSAFAGYYLGLAKFNPEHRGPIVIKGLLIATAIHATYNSTVGIGAGLFGLLFQTLGIPTFGGLLAYFAYVILYDGFFGLLLFRKIRRYRVAYRSAHEGGRGEPTTSELAEFDS
ncbi:PrsW family intramembrane metalloprotease [Halorarum halophilum]|uniref:PrsW family intramembrane metalloprotease n=1 Tax=Halorarum halophilum TaxID=2743090 RepID=A0A7D5K9J6_9EURY|nr:PrsW family intramembrane metalloprotease [Halobaculum halophilum]QLG29154.1 PrsW family intramembrane metalloprotease [Halobaculum halophilum]